jgi:hypothetical protein
MSFSRKLARNVIRKQVGNKNVQEYWRAFRFKSIRDYVEKLGVEDKESLVKKLWKRVLNSIQSATKKKPRRK